MSDIRKKILLLTTALFLAGMNLFAESHLLFFEFQSVGGYNWTDKKVIWHSLFKDEVMQKPSLGLDYIQRFYQRNRDWGNLAVQLRLAYQPSSDNPFQFQLYNAFVKYKAGFANIWLGHARPALGLSSYLDSHALLLPTMTLWGYGFDRDWGLGASRDFTWGNFAISLTSGSGMPLYLKGNYLLSARLGKGDWYKENYHLGFSLAYGKTLETMGYQIIMDPKPYHFAGAGLDYSFILNNWENRFEIWLGEKMDKTHFVFFWRTGMGLLAENRLKIEFQPIVKKALIQWEVSLFTGISWQINADWTCRTMLVLGKEKEFRQWVIQLYYYKKI